jgi:hypothetical protein
MEHFDVSIHGLFSSTLILQAACNVISQYMLHFILIILS